MQGKTDKPIEILLVEDSPSDAKLTAKALSQGEVATILHVVEDGVDAIAFLHQQGRYIRSPRPDLILLDLNLPRKNGREVLAEVKSDPILCTIPIIVLTTSEDELDILQGYQLHANCYVTKPANLEQFQHLVELIERFWLTLVKLPLRS